MITEVFDIDGTERDLAWLAANYDGCTVLPARVPEGAVEYWRLAAIFCTTGPATMKVEARRGSVAADNQPVVMTWPALDAPSPDLAPLPDNPHNWSSRGVIQRTEISGVTGFGLGRTFGPFYHAWIMSSAASDCLTKTGMKGSTNHNGPLHGVWVLTPVNAEPEPDTQVLAVLARIEARLNALAEHLGA